MKKFVAYILIGIAVLFYRIDTTDRADLVISTKKWKKKMEKKTSSERSSVIIKTTFYVVLVIGILVWPVSLFNIIRGKVQDFLDQIDD